MSFALYLVNGSRGHEADAFHSTHLGMAMIRAVLAMGGVLVKAEGDDRAFRALSRGKVPERKLRTNDNWILVPEECEILADAITRVLEERGAELDAWLAGGEPRTQSWDTPQNDKRVLAEFSAFCRRAATHGGFEVT